MALTKIPGELFSVGDLDISDVGTISLDAIQGDADSNTSITFSGSDVITIATGGSNRLTIGDGALSPVTDNQIDLGTSSLEFKDAYFDGTVTSDAFAGPLTGDVTGNVSGTAATVTGAAQSNITSLGTLTTLTVDNVIVNGTTIGHTSDTDLMTLADGSLTVAGTLTATKLVSTNGVLELDDNGSHNGIINVPASITINIDSDDGATNETFSIAKDKTGINDTDVLFRVQEDGNVGIGTASPASKLDIHTAGSTARPLAIRITNADYTNYAWEIWRDNTTGHLRFGHENAGTDSNRISFLADGGITFGDDVAAANALDDYEEGDWNPGIISGGSTNPTGGGYVSIQGSYVKIGRQVWVNFYVGRSWTNSPNGQIHINGLPFTPTDNNDNIAHVPIVTYNMDGAGCTFAAPALGGTTLLLYQQGSGAWASQDWQSHATSPIYLAGQVSYFV